MIQTQKSHVLGEGWLKEIIREIGLECSGIGKNKYVYGVLKKMVLERMEKYENLVMIRQGEEGEEIPEWEISLVFFLFRNDKSRNLFFSLNICHDIVSCTIHQAFHSGQWLTE